MKSFPSIDPDGEAVLTFNCINRLDPGEVLAGGITLKGVTCTAGIDPNPMAVVLGSPSYDSTATKMLLLVGNFANLNGNDYVFELISATSFPGKIVVARAVLPVRAN